MLENIKTSVKLPVEPRVLYEAWLSSTKHSEFTGSKAVIKRKVGSEFSAWDGYITGEIIAMYRFNKIILNWRCTDFPEGSEDSTVEVHFDPDKDGSKLTIIHTGIPEGDGKKYRKGWKDAYFKPMKEYFAPEQSS